MARKSKEKQQEKRRAAAKPNAPSVRGKTPPVPKSPRGVTLQKPTLRKPAPRDGDKRRAVNTDRAPEKAVYNKSVPHKRKKFRGGNYVLYYVLGVIVIVVAFIILANTVLFKCAGINVSGNEKYSAEEIIGVSGLTIGENLLHISTSEARENIVNALAYVDEAEVKKSFPTKINITVTEAEKQYCIAEGGITAAVSRKGKILEHCEVGGLPIVRGYDAESTEVGAWLKSGTEGKTNIPADIFKAADKTGLKNITEVDMKDKFSVKVKVEDRVVLSLGAADELESKFRVAVEIIDNQLGKDEYVTLLLTNPKKVPVQNNSVPQQSRPASVLSSAVSSTTSVPAQPTSVPDPEPTSDPDPEPTPDPELPEN